MAVPYTFANATVSIPLSQLDNNFATTITLGNTAIQLGNTVTTLNNMTMANVTVSSGNATLTTANVTNLSSSNVAITGGTIANVTISGSGSNITATNINASNVTVSTDLTLSGGTANGVAYLNGSKVLTSGSALTFDGSNLGIATTTPNIIVNNSSVSALAGTVFQYLGTAFARDRAVAGTGEYRHEIGLSAGFGGFHSYYVDGSEQMRLTSTGLGIGTSSPDTKLDVRGEISVAYNATYGIRFYNQDRNNWSSIGNNTATGNTGANLVFKSGTGTMTFDNAGNLGLGVTPSAWYSNQKAFQIAAIGSLRTDGTNVFGVNNNAYFAQATTDWRYSTSNYASRYDQVFGQHQWYTAPSGTAGTAISFTQAMTLDASGNLLVGTTLASRKLGVGGDLGIGSDSSRTYELYIAQTSSYARIGPTYNTGGSYVPLTFWTSDTERMRIDSSGNVGIGTSSPTTSLQIGNPSDSNQALLFSFPDSATGMLNSTRLAGGTQQSLRLAAGEGLQFYTSGAERMRIDSSGNLLVGKTSASYTTVGAFITVGGIVNSAGTSDFWNSYSTTAGAYRFYVTNAGTVTATSTSISAISDQRFKENIRDLDDGLDVVMALKPRKFDWKEGKGPNTKDARGFIAQEFEQVFPDLIDEWKDPAPEGEEPYKSVRQDLIPVLVKAIQELKAELDATKAEVAALKAK